MSGQRGSNYSVFFIALSDLRIRLRRRRRSFFSSLAKIQHVKLFEVSHLFTASDLSGIHSGGEKISDIYSVFLNVVNDLDFQVTGFFIKDKAELLA